MAITTFDREVLSKAMDILRRESEFAVAEEIRRFLWRAR